MTRVAILGGGISGLLAAAAVRGHVDEIVVLERDPMPADVGLRRGVPQGEQLHNLLGRAQLHLEELLPGFIDALRQEGCGEGVASSDTHVWELGVRMPERDLGLRVIGAHRPTIDRVARNLLGADLSLLDDATVLSPVVGSGSAIVGVQFLRDGARQELLADLVIDATGSTALGARWLSDNGNRIRIDEVNTQQWYVSATVRPKRAWSERPFLMVFPTPPATRGGMMSPAGDGTWHASVSGRSADAIPRTYAAMVAHAETLEDPVVARALTECLPIGEPRTFRKSIATWRRFDLQQAPASGFIALGDAIASLNPLFGQGISVAAWQAKILRDLLDAGETINSPQLPHTYFSAAFETVDTAWQLGHLVTEALVYRDEGPVVDLTPALAALIGEDPRLHEQYVRVWHLLAPATALSEPAFRQELLRRARIV